MSTILRLRAGDALHEIRTSACEGGWEVEVDGAVLAVARRGLLAAPTRIEGATVGEHLLEVDGRVVRAVVARTADRVAVAVAGETHVFVVDDGSSAGHAGGVGTGRILAPMPGTVVQVLVAAGDRVATGDPVVVVEAMKMETTLVADVDGTVAAVHAAAGATVDGDAVLVEITPDA